MDILWDIGRFKALLRFSGWVYINTINYMCNVFQNLQYILSYRKFTFDLCLISSFSPVLTLFGLGFFPTLKDWGGERPIAITPVFQVRWSWNLVVIPNGSCLPQIHRKSWWHHRYFDSLTSSSFLCISTSKTSNFSSFHQIKLKFGLGVDFGILISNFNSKIVLSVKIWWKKA